MLNSNGMVTAKDLLTLISCSEGLNHKSTKRNAIELAESITSITPRRWPSPTYDPDRCVQLGTSHDPRGSQRQSNLHHRMARGRIAVCRSCHPNQIRHDQHMMSRVHYNSPSRLGIASALNFQTTTVINPVEDYDMDLV